MAPSSWSALRTSPQPPASGLEATDGSCWAGVGKFWVVRMAGAVNHPIAISLGRATCVMSERLGILLCMLICRLEGLGDGVMALSPLPTSAGMSRAAHATVSDSLRAQGAYSLHVWPTHELAGCERDPQSRHFAQRPVLQMRSSAWLLGLQYQLVCRFEVEKFFHPVGASSLSRSPRKTKKEKASRSFAGTHATPA